MDSTFSKYFQPTSLTWWTGIASLVAGVLLVLAPAIPAVAPLASLASGFFPGQAGGPLIIAGMGLIGIKGAIVSNSVETLDSVVKLVKITQVIPAVLTPAKP